MPMLRTFLQISGISFTLLAAFFLAKGNLGLSVEMIAELSFTKLSYNLDVTRSLSRQQGDTWVGVVLLLIAFGLQMWNALWPMRIGDFGVHRGAAIYAIVFSLVFGFGGYFLAEEISANTMARVKKIMDARVSPDTPRTKSE